METTTKKIPKARWFFIIPVCFLTNFFCFMDRQVISIALPGGMMKDLAMNSTISGFVAGVVSIGLLFLTIPAGQLAQKGRVKKFIGLSIAGWSIFTFLTALIQNEWQLIAVRFMLGFCEGGIAPGVTTLITFWFPDKNGERNRANSAYFTSVSIAAIIMGPLSGAIIGAFGWRDLFIIIGIASAITCILWTAFIYDRPEQAKWLSKEERDYIETTIKEEREAAKNIGGNVKASGERLPLGLLLRNKYVWSLCIIGFTVNIGQFGFSMWVPTMIKNITKANIMTVGLISAIPSIFTVIGLWCWSYIAAKVKSRRATTGIPLLMFGGALLVANLVTGLVGPVVGIALICLVQFFLQGHMPSYYTIPSLVLVKELDGAARGLMSMAMGLGSFVGPYVVGFLMTLTGGSTKAAIYFLIVMLVIGSASSLILPKNLGAAKKIKVENSGVSVH